MTEYTSLLVLDSLKDYLRYKVAPKDADLLEKYNRYVYLNEQKSKYAEEKEKRRAIVDSIRIANKIKKWWKKDFKQEPPPAPNEPWNFERKPKNLDKENRLIGSISTQPLNEHVLRNDNGNIIGKIIPTKNISERLSTPVLEEKQTEAKTKIKLKKWSPNTPYMKELRKIKDADLYKAYLKLRKEYQDMPAFFFDVADEFAKRNMADKSTLVLTNLLEMKIDNVELLRVTAHKLQSYGQYQMAEILIQKKGCFKSIFR